VARKREYGFLGVLKEQDQVNTEDQSAMGSNFLGEIRRDASARFPVQETAEIDNAMREKQVTLHKNVVKRERDENAAS